MNLGIFPVANDTSPAIRSRCGRYRSLGPLFGELAIARCLERDGWEAVWVDSYHSKKERLFWRDLPDRSLPFDLSRVQVAHEAYERIFIVNGGVGGFFDVLAWKGSEVVFIEYKGARDGPNGNELRWIESALQAGLDESSLYFVLY